MAITWIFFLLDSVKRSKKGIGSAITVRSSRMLIIDVIQARVKMLRHLPSVPLVQTVQIKEIGRHCKIVGGRKATR